MDVTYVYDLVYTTLSDVPILLDSTFMTYNRLTVIRCFFYHSICPIIYFAGAVLNLFCGCCINLPVDRYHGDSVYQQPIGGTDMAVCSICVPTTRICSVRSSSHGNCFHH